MAPWYIFALLSVAFSVSYGLISKKLLTNEDDHDPIAYAGVLFIAVALISTVAYIFSGNNLEADLAGFNNPTVIAILAANLILYTLAASLYWRSLKQLPASEVSILYDLTTVYIFIFGVTLGTELFSMTRLIGGSFVVGAALILGFVTTRRNEYRVSQHVWMLLIATILYALAALTDNAIISKEYFSPLFFQILNFGIPAILLFLLNFRSLSNVPKILKPSMRKYIVVNSLFFFGSFWAIFQAYNADGVTSEVNFVLASETVITVLLAALLLKEKDHLTVKIFCAILATIGIALLI